MKVAFIILAVLNLTFMYWAWLEIRLIKQYRQIDVALIQSNSTGLIGLAKAMRDMDHIDEQEAKVEEALKKVGR
jgi:hypothetical protein